MIKGTSKTVREYIDNLEPERKKAITAVRKVIRKNLPKGYVENLNWGMISYEVPLSRVGDTYNGQPLMYAALGSQKNYMSLYLMGVYCDTRTATWFKKSWAAAGKKLDMGKSCVRFKKLDDVPLDVVGEVIARVPMETYVEFCQAARSRRIR